MFPFTKLLCNLRVLSCFSTPLILPIPPLPHTLRQLVPNSQQNTGGICLFSQFKLPKSFPVKQHHPKSACYSSSDKHRFTNHLLWIALSTWATAGDSKLGPPQPSDEHNQNAGGMSYQSSMRSSLTQGLQYRDSAHSRDHLNQIKMLRCISSPHTHTAFTPISYASQ